MTTSALHSHKESVSRILPLLMFVTLCAGLVPAASADSGKQRYTIPGLAVTGTNSLRGQWVDPVLASLFMFFPTIENGATTGHYAPGEFESEVFSCDSPDSAIMATHPNAGFIAAFWGPDAYLHPAVIHNTPFEDVPITVGPQGQTAPVPFTYDAPNAWTPQRNDGVAGYTLGQYLQASGELKIKCDAETGDFRYKLEAEGLVPNGLYSLWSNHGPQPPDFDTLAAFGGPTIVTADEDGEVEIERSVAHCPADAWIVGMAYHSNFKVTGNVPEHAPDLGAAHDHLQFFIRMELESPGATEAFDPCP